MAKEDLNSDRVNYLIWRYLQEANYLGTAVKLQAEWNQVDPQSLDFAPHVGPGALVNLLKHGLRFDEADRKVNQARLPGGADARGLFGPVPPLSPPLAAEEDPINARKRTSEERPQHSRQTSPAKRAKLSNGYENGIVEPTAMDLDEQDTTDANSNNGHVYPSPEEIDFEHHQPPPPTTSGPEKATQADKPHDLTQEALTVTLTDDDDAKAPTIYQCEWNPKDSNNLITVGLDMPPRSWRIVAEKDSAIEVKTKLGAKWEELPISKNEINGTVTYLSYSLDGESIAIASDCLDNGTVTIIAKKDGEVKSTFPSNGRPPIISLRWSATNQYVLALTSPAIDGGSSWVSVFDTFTGKSVELELAPGSQPLDAVWTKEGGFAICDGETLIQYEHDTESINQLREYPENGSPIFLAYDSPSGLLATSAESGKIIVWNSLEKHMELQAHDGPVTAIKWQPGTSDADIVLASSGEDQTVKLWRMGPAKSSKPFQTMHLGSGVLDISFTPRGDLLAAATNSHIAIFNMTGNSTPTVPVATWMTGKHLGWQSSKQTNGHVQEEDHHILKWDPQGTKLVYGVKSMLTFIAFNPAYSIANGHS